MSGARRTGGWCKAPGDNQSVHLYPLHRVVNFSVLSPDSSQVTEAQEPHASHTTQIRLWFYHTYPAGLKVLGVSSSLRGEWLEQMSHELEVWSQLMTRLRDAIGTFKLFVLIQKKKKGPGLLVGLGVQSIR